MKFISGSPEYDRMAYARVMLDGAKEYLSYCANNLGDALADGDSAEDLELKLYLFKSARLSYRAAKNAAEEEEKNWLAWVEQKMPPTALTVEGVEIPNIQEGDFNG